MSDLDKIFKYLDTHFYIIVENILTIHSFKDIKIWATYSEKTKLENSFVNYLNKNALFEITYLGSIGEEPDMEIKYHFRFDFTHPDLISGGHAVFKFNSFDAFIKEINNFNLDKFIK